MTIRITQAEGDFLKASLNQTLKQLEDARATYKRYAKSAKKEGLTEDANAYYKEFAKINEYLKKFAEIQRKIKRGAFIEDRTSITVYGDYHISAQDFDLRSLRWSDK